MSLGFVYKRRLLKLAELLESLPEDKFDFQHWAGTEWAGKANLSCGTTACAFGWATTIPALKRLGLRLYRNRCGQPWIGIGDDQSDESHFNAAEKVFGLDVMEFNLLFIQRDHQDWEDEEEVFERFGRESPNSRASAKEVTDTIRWFVEHKYGKN